MFDLSPGSPFPPLILSPSQTWYRYKVGLVADLSFFSSVADPFQIIRIRIKYAVNFENAPDPTAYRYTQK